MKLRAIGGEIQRFMGARLRRPEGGRSKPENLSSAVQGSPTISGGAKPCEHSEWMRPTCNMQPLLLE